VPLLAPVDEGDLIGVQGVNDELEADEAEDDRQAVVEVDESVEQPVNEEVELAQAQQGEGVGGEDQEGLAGQGVDRGDGVDGEHDIGGADGDDAQHHGSNHGAPGVAVEGPAPPQARRPRSVRVPISAKLVANMLYSAGIDRVLTVDLHADQIQGFFDIPVDNIYATPILLNDINQQRIENLTVVSPDIGGVLRARAVAKALNADLAIIDKRRPKANVAEVMNIIGDIQDRTCLIVDDMIDTANTLCKAASALKERGASRVLAYATHPVFSGEAINRIASSDIDQVVVTDTIPLSDAAKTCGRIREVTIAGLLAETVRRISNEESVSYLFNEDVMITGSMLLP